MAEGIRLMRPPLQVAYLQVVQGHKQAIHHQASRSKINSMTEDAARLDKAIAELSALAQRHQERVESTGRELVKRAKERDEQTVNARRAAIEEEHRLLERAKRYVLEKQVSRRRSLDPWTLIRFEDYAKTLARFEERTGGLGATPAVQAYLAEYDRHCDSAIVRLQDEAKRMAGAEPEPTPAGRPASLTRAQIERARARRRVELDPEQEPGRHLAFELSELLKEVLDQPLETIHSENDWWEVLVLVLLTACPDVEAEELGVHGLRPYEEWVQPGGDLFNHRGGMQTYLGLDGERHAEEVRRAFEGLAVRAATNLGRISSRGAGGRSSESKADLESTPRPTEPVRGPLSVDRSRCVARVFGVDEEFDITENQATVLDKLIQADGAWVPGKNLLAGRVDRVIKRLDPAIRRHIEASVSGYRIKRPRC